MPSTSSSGSAPSRSRSARVPVPKPPPSSTSFATTREIKRSITNLSGCTALRANEIKPRLLRSSFSLSGSSSKVLSSRSRLSSVSGCSRAVWVTAVAYSLSVSTAMSAGSGVGVSGCSFVGCLGSSSWGWCVRRYSQSASMPCSAAWWNPSGQRLPPKANTPLPFDGFDDISTVVNLPRLVTVSYTHLTLPTIYSV